MDFLSYFGTFAAFAGGVVAITKIINELLKTTSKAWKQITAWIVSILMAVIGFWQQLGFFANYGQLNDVNGWIMTGVVGIAAGIFANGLYDIKYVKMFLNWIATLLKKQPVE